MDCLTAAYDAENRLTTLQYTDALGVVRKTEYAYSGDDFLAVVKQYEDGTLTDETRIVRDGLLALQDRNANNTVRREYTWGLNLGGGIGGLLDMKQGGVHYSYFYDGKGNVEAVLDWEKNVAAAYRYDPFGKLLAKSGALEQPFQFSTKRVDELTGLSYYGYRFYSPEMGRWTTRDPLGEAGGINLYAFVGNSPVNWVDPWGLTMKCVLKMMLVTAYCVTGPGKDWAHYKPKAKGDPVGSVGPGTIAVANSKTQPYPFGSTMEVLDITGVTDDDQFVYKADYKGAVHDTGAGWDAKHHNVPSDRWIDIWLSPCQDAMKWGKQWRLVKICYDDSTECPQ